HERADPEPPVRLAERVEPGDPVDVDDGPRRREAELHQRDQALSAGQDLPLVAEPFEDRQRLVERVGREVFEAGGVHPTASLCRVSRATIRLSGPYGLAADPDR